MRYSATALPQWYLEGSRTYGAKGFQKAAAKFSPNALSDMRGRVACVTGANSGIGFCVAQALAERNAIVHMICRSQEKGQEARLELLEKTGNENVYLHVVDVSDFDQVENFSREFVKANPSLNVLVNNAGGMPSERITTPQGNESIMATMLGGTFLLTKLLLPALVKAEEDDGSRDLSRRGRVINVSSAGMYTVSGKGIASDLNSETVEPYDGALVYALAKRAQVMLTERWAQTEKRVTFSSMHPGWSDTPGLATGMPGFQRRQQGSLRRSEEGADTIVWLACAEEAKGETGKFWFDRQARRTHLPLSFTECSAEEKTALWEAVEKYCFKRS